MSHFWSCGHELPKKIPNSSTDFNSYNLGVHFFSYSTPKPKQCTTNCKASHFAGHFMKKGGSFQVKTLNHRLLGKYHLNENTKNDRILVIFHWYFGSFRLKLHFPPEGAFQHPWSGRDPGSANSPGRTPVAKSAHFESENMGKDHVEKKTHIYHIYIYFFFSDGPIDPPSFDPPVFQYFFNPSCLNLH